MSWKLGDKSPIATTLKLTYRCNLSCLHCPWHSAKSEEISCSEWKEIIRQLYQAGVRHLVFEGGEPTLRPDLSELVGFAGELEIYTTIATNGTRSLEKYHPDRFLISIDGLKDTHNQLRGEGSFEKALEQIEKAKSRVELLVTINRLNHHQLEEICEFFSGKVSGLWFSFNYDYQNAHPLGLNQEEMICCAQKLVELKEKYPITNFNRYLKQVGKKRACYPWLLWTVLPDGSIIKDCMIQALEDYDCSRCELACHREISLLLDPRAWLEEARVYLKNFFLSKFESNQREEIVRV